MRTVALLALGLCACGTSELLSAGDPCVASSNCDFALMCLDTAQFTGSACTVAKTCSITCEDDTSCQNLGPDFKCFATCTADKVCTLVGSP